MERKIIRVLPPVVGMVLFGGALWVLHHELALYHLADVRRYLHAVPLNAMVSAVSLTLVSYLVMSGYDILALRSIHHPLPYRKVTLASFIGYAFSNNMGLSMLAGASVRYTLYSAWGLSPSEIGKVVVFCTLTLWLGFCSLCGGLFVAEAGAIPTGLHLASYSFRLLGLGFLLIVTGYILLCVRHRKPLALSGRKIHLPTPRFVVPQIVLAVLDWTIAGGVLYVLLPTGSALSYAAFLVIFLLAQLAGLASQVPGGIGVFESAVLLLLKPFSPAPAILGSLVIYRLTYYLLPLLLAAVLLGGVGIVRHRRKIQGVLQTIDSGVSLLIPWLFSLVAFGGGVILLFSGATPAISRRLALLEHFLPLAVAEVSHFLASLAGAGLLLLARGLQRRLDGAYVLTLFLLGAGIVLSLMKGLDYEEALVLTVILTALLPCRRYFYRRAALLSQPFTVGWIISIMLVLAATAWMVFFSYKHVEYSEALWWRFAFMADAPRSLRAMVGAAAVVGFFALARLLRPRPPLDSAREAVDITRVERLVSLSFNSNAHLALLGDKRFLFSRSGGSFIMYGVRGRSWVAMGDPVGPVDEWPELIWRFQELSDLHSGWPVFYEVGHRYLRYYVDIGLIFFKLGEKARVPLTNFSLAGRSAKGFRYTLHRLEKDGFRFSVLPREKVPDLLQVLSEVSNAWLASKNTREKGFSLGFFKPAYLARFPVALVRKNEKICAFANLWQAPAGGELSIDLMRYRPEEGHGLMDFLFLHLMLWGRERGYQWFNLGMAPLSGIVNHPLAPLWNRVGAFVFQHGQHFYNFAGLRRYKEKFHPVWEPCFLAVPGRVKLLPILGDITALVSGTRRERTEPQNTGGKCEGQTG